MNEPEPHCDLVFLLSAAFSGATLLSVLLSERDGVSSDGDLFHPKRGVTYRCTCGKNQTECSYFAEIFSKIYDRGSKAYDFDYFYYVPRYSRYYLYSRSLEGFLVWDLANSLRRKLVSMVPAYVRLNEDFIRIHTEAFRKSRNRRNASLYLDGTKWMRRVELFAEQGVQFRMIHLARDPRGFASSYVKNNGWEMNRRSIDHAVGYWMRHLRKVEALRRRFPEIECMSIRYEDVCDRPAESIASLREFMGVDPHGDAIPPERRDYHVTGNNMRMEFDGVVKLDERWRRSIPQSLQERIVARTSDYCKRYGYAPGNS